MTSFSSLISCGATGSIDLARPSSTALSVEPRIALATATLTFDEVAIVLLQELVAEPPFGVPTDRTTYLQRNPMVVRQLGATVRSQLAAVSRICSVEPVAHVDVMEMANNMAADGLLPRDAIHVAVARRLGIEAIVSDDDAFDRVPGIRLYKPEPEP